MPEAEQNRSEAPTPFKLERARRKGTVARGLDLAFLAGLAAFLLFAWFAGQGLALGLAQAMRDALVTSGQLAGDRAAIIRATGLLFGAIRRPILELAITAFLTVLLFELVQTGFIFSSQPLKPDFSRLNPAQGLKKLFSLRLLLETAKNILKLAVYTTVIALVIRFALRGALGTISDAPRLLHAGTDAGRRLLTACGLCAAAFTALDQLIVRRDFLKRMRMSRREVKHELRDREGEPRLKQRRKQMHAEFVRTSQSLRALKGADMLIVNPRHVAVALRYDRWTMAAPTVVALGTDRLALRLKRLAFVYGIPIIEDRQLARALMRGTRINRPIDPATYQPVADLYNRLRHQRSKG
jgi:flagellar biosynthetic protein FlhB